MNRTEDIRQLVIDFVRLVLSEWRSFAFFAVVVWILVAGIVCIYAPRGG